MQAATLVVNGAGQRWVTLCLLFLPLAVRVCGQPRPTVSSPATRPTSDGVWLRVTGNDVLLRSRPDNNSVPFVRLQRDALLHAAGHEFGWYKVLPPEGAFCYVAAAYVDRRSPTEGVVAVQAGSLRVRVGSLVWSVDPATSDVLTTLPSGTPVTILGADGAWLRIAPPTGVYGYIREELVTPIDAETAARLRASGVTTTRPAAAAAPRSALPASRPMTPVTTSPDLSGPWGQRLRAVEAEIEAEAARPVLERHWEALVARLRPIADQAEDPVAARLAGAWIQDLEDRIAARDALRAAREVEQQGAPQRAQRERELQRLEQARQRIATAPAWTVCGILLPSLAVGMRDENPTLKVQDPVTWRVLAYLEFDAEVEIDTKPLVGRYVGVRGARRTDARLGAEVVRVTEIVPLDTSTAATRPARPTP